MGLRIKNVVGVVMGGARRVKKVNIHEGKDGKRERESREN